MAAMTITNPDLVPTLTVRPKADGSFVVEGGYPSSRPVELTSFPTQAECEAWIRGFMSRREKGLLK